MTKQSTKMKKLEIRDRIFHLETIVTKPSLIQIPEDEVIIGIEQVPGSATRFTVWTAKDVTDAG